MSKEQQQYQKLVMTPVEKLIPRLAIPTILSMMITMIYNLVDAFFVGKLGTSASAAIGVVLGSGNWGPAPVRRSESCWVSSRFSRHSDS